ncbi:YecH family metal-binding protein [Escherichia coli]
MDSIHGHEVLNMMIESGEQYTHASLEAAIKARFGEQARFHTSRSAEGMTAGELVAFLAAKGKILTPSEEGFSTDQSKICRH